MFVDCITEVIFLFFFPFFSFIFHVSRGNGIPFEAPKTHPLFDGDDDLTSNDLHGKVDCGLV